MISVFSTNVDTEISLNSLISSSFPSMALTDFVIRLEPTEMGKSENVIYGILFEKYFENSLRNSKDFTKKHSESFNTTHDIIKELEKTENIVQNSYLYKYKDEINRNDIYKNEKKENKSNDSNSQNYKNKNGNANGNGNQYDFENEKSNDDDDDMDNNNDDNDNDSFHIKKGGSLDEKLLRNDNNDNNGKDDNNNSNNSINNNNSNNNNNIDIPSNKNIATSNNKNNKIDNNNHNKNNNNNHNNKNKNNNINNDDNSNNNNNNDNNIRNDKSDENDKTDNNENASDDFFVDDSLDRRKFSSFANAGTKKMKGIYINKNSNKNNLEK